MEDLTREFLLESHEGLDRMERGLSQLAETPADGESLREIFRAVHTIKGTTGFLGFERLERVSHAGENLLVKMRDGELAVSTPLMEVLLRLLDTLRSILRGIEQDDREPEGADINLLAQLEAFQSSPALPEATQLQPLVNVAAAVEQSDTLIQEKIEKNQSNSENTTAAVNSAEVATVVAESSDAGTSVVDSTVRVDVDVLQRLMNLAGELVLTRNQIMASAGDGPMSALAQKLDRVTSEIRDAVMRVRMQPVEQVFSRFPRMVRELARQCGKQVRLEMEGQQTRLDRSVLELMRDPLLHAIRNAIDHGIEPPEIRSSKGKPAEGRLRLRAASVGDHVLIEIIDDGGGIVPDRMRQHAVKKGLLSAEQASVLTDAEARNLVFAAGFSTAAQVTNVSGRGVGLDVVRQNVERVGGSVVLESAVGAGTTIRMRLPLTLAILPALILRCAGQRFALPQMVIEELHHFNSVQQMGGLETLGTMQLYRLRDHLLPLADLRALLHLKNTEDVTASKKNECSLAVVNTEGRRFVLLVDHFEGTEELVVKPLDRITDVPVFSGAAQLADGDLTLILDAAGVADLAGITESQSTIDTESAAGASVGEGYLHVALRDVPAAISIAQVEHVVTVQASDIQSMGGVLVLHTEEEILPLLDGVRGSQGLDIEALIPATTAPASSWHVLVCRQDEGRMGLLVSAVYGMVQAPVHTVKNVEHPEEPERSILCVGNDLVRVIEPMDWRHFVAHPEEWTRLSGSQWQEPGGSMLMAPGMEARG